jgi:hypothetical protein
MPKLNERQVRRIIAAVHAGAKVADVAKRFCISRVMVDNIVSGRCWKSIVAEMEASSDSMTDEELDELIAKQRETMPHEGRDDNLWYHPSPSVTLPQAVARGRGLKTRRSKCDL